MNQPPSIGSVPAQPNQAATGHRESAWSMLNHNQGTASSGSNPDQEHQDCRRSSRLRRPLSIRHMEKCTMNIMLVSPLVALLSGIAILVWPRLLNYIVAFYLILFGALGLLVQLQ
jgi:hypothetical protein